MNWQRVIRTAVLLLVAFSLFGCSLTINTCQFGHAGDGGTVVQGGPVVGEESSSVEGWVWVGALFAVVTLLLVFAVASRDGLGPGLQ